MSGGRAFALAACVLFFATTAEAAPRDKVFEEKILADLSAINPALVPTFRDATAASDAGNYTKARTGFLAVHEGAPQFDPALRRLCMSEMGLDNTNDAVAHCRQALSISRSPENESALALALVGGDLPSSSSQREAKNLVAEATQQKPDDGYIQEVACQVDMKSEDIPAMQTCTAHLLDLEPNVPEAHVFRALALAMSGDIDAGKKELDRAHALGFPDAAYFSLRGNFDKARPLYQRIFGFFAPIFLVWGFGLAILYAVGIYLSKLTLRASQQPPRQGTEIESTEGERRLRKIYRSVIKVGAFYFYVSIPLVAITVVGCSAAFILGALIVGHVPLQLMFIAGLVSLYTLRAIFKSMFTPVKDEAPGVKLDLSSEPKLVAVLAETAAKVGTRPVDAVYLVTDTTLAVTERGGMLTQLRGRGERALILGVGALEGMKVRPLKAILAHEYGHFRNEDTAGGGIALAARRSLQLMALHMAIQGVATWYNPAWWFIRAYAAVYLQISQGASRLQEVLADRWAVLAFGAEDFIAGLRHVVMRTIDFEHHVEVSLKEIIERKTALANLYTYAPEKVSSTETTHEDFEKAWNREPSPYDSHPRGADREVWARALGASGAAAASDDGEPAWSLFADRTTLEKSMTDVVRTRLAKRGVSI